MRAQKIAISLEKTPKGRYNVQVLGINGATVVSSVSDLETLEAHFGTAVREFEHAFASIRLRLSRGQMEFVVKEKSDDDETEPNG